MGSLQRFVPLRSIFSSSKQPRLSNPLTEEQEMKQWLGKRISRELFLQRLPLYLSSTHTYNLSDLPNRPYISLSLFPVNRCTLYVSISHPLNLSYLPNIPYIALFLFHKKVHTLCFYLSSIRTFNLSYLPNTRYLYSSTHTRIDHCIRT